MDTNITKKIKRKVFLLFPLAFIMLMGIFWLSAGSLKYWQAWVFCFALFLPTIFTVTYFFKKSPEFLEKRMKFKEKELKQKKIIKIANIVFSIGFIIPGLDYRFGWSSVPLWLVLASNAIILLSFSLVFLAFRENHFAARTVEVFEDQKVISTGPYAIVRHPMYAGMLPMLLFMPLALGSFWATIAFIPVGMIIVIRTLNEEEVLKRGLPGYTEYCKKVRYRIIPFIW